MLKVDKENTNKYGAYYHIDARKGNAFLPEKEGAQEPQNRICNLHRRVAE